MYATDPDYAAQVKKDQRERYRKENPPIAKLENGLQARGEQREVFAEDMEHPVVVETFTINEAAKALGRSELTLKRWIEEDMIPPPILRDTVRSYRHYSVGELRVVARILREHEREFSYYAKTHEQTTHRLFQSMQGYRSNYV